MNLKGPKILFFLAGVLFQRGLFVMKLTTEGLRIKFFIAGISLLKGSLCRGFNVLCLTNKRNCRRSSQVPVETSPPSLWSPTVPRDNQCPPQPPATPRAYLPPPKATSSSRSRQPSLRPPVTPRATSHPPKPPATPEVTHDHRGHPRPPEERWRL
jgi:hypothetical protein